MSLDEEAVFEHVTKCLSEKGYDFFVDCQYQSVLSRYEKHSIVIPPNSVPDIVGISPDKKIVTVEVKGNTGIKKGRGQASTNRSGSHLAYLAADEGSIAAFRSELHADGIGTIGVEPDGTVNWDDPPRGPEKTALPDVRNQLRSQLRGFKSFSKIAGLQLAHPIQFIAPAVVLNEVSPYGPMDKADFKSRMAEEYVLEGSAISNSIKGASVLNFIDGQESLHLTEAGYLGIDVLDQYGVSSPQELVKLKEQTSSPDSIYSVNPTLGLWFQDQYRKQPEFNTLYEVLRDFEPGEPIEITEILEILLREYPNTFLQIFCTDKPSSRGKARQLIRDGNREKIYNDMGVLRDVLRQNICQNFVRQLQHIGVLDSKTSSTTKPLAQYHPGDYPWYVTSDSTNAKIRLQ